MRSDNQFMKKIIILILFVITHSNVSYANPYNMTDEQVITYTILMEARGESLNGMRGVAQVISNRGGAKACLKKWQFSCWNTIPSQDCLIKLGEETERSGHWTEAARLARGIGLGIVLIPELRFATHYYNPKLCSPSWASFAKEVRDLGNHRFIKL